MFIVYFALWVILNGKWTTEIGVFGLVFAGVLYAFCCRFTGVQLQEGNAVYPQSSVCHPLRRDAAVRNL